MWRINLTFEVIAAFVHANLILLFTKNKIQVPAVTESTYSYTQEIQKWVKFTDSLLKFMIYTRKHNCFFRSFVRMKILRKRNVPVKLNIGLRNLDADIHTRGHCWLTLEDSLFYENMLSETHLLPDELYPFFLGSYNDVVYWVNGKDGDDLVRSS